MDRLLRLLLIILGVAAALLSFSALLSLFQALLAGGREDLATRFFAAPLFGIVFYGPRALLFGSLPFMIAMILMDRLRIERLLPYVAVWIGAGVVMVWMGFPPATALAASALSGVIYWMIAGRTAAVAHKVVRNPNAFHHRFGRFAAYAIMAYLGYQAAVYGYHGLKLLRVSMIASVDPGTPPYRPYLAREMTAGRKLAMLEFPDPLSCLTPGSGELTPERLRQMDWSRIENTHEAEVCTFRLLASHDDISYATDWLLAQGFSVGDSWSSANPHVGRDGTLRVDGGYSIRRNGPKFPEAGVFRRAFLSIPHAMSIQSTWDADGRELISARVSFSTL